MEDKLFNGKMSPVSTEVFHKFRDRANHWEQGHQRPRMEMALNFIGLAIDKFQLGDAVPSLVDLGCGDGGLLEQVMIRYPQLRKVWGFDFQPSNVKAAQEERGLPVTHADVFNSAVFDRDTAVHHGMYVADIVVMTEVLEHLESPQRVLRRISDFDATDYIIASSPWGEHRDSHDACHAWAWDQEGYEALFNEAGWRIVRHEVVDWSQVVWAEVCR